MKILPTQFDGQSIRRVYDEDTEIWWFSVIDVVQVLTDSTYANRYWSDLKRKLAQEAGTEQPYEKIVRLKLQAPDGKQRLTDCATAESLLRIVQSIPSPKAEPIKLWLAKVGYERMQEMADPALSLDRARQTWQQHGRSDKWIAQRMTGQETRNKLTDFWREHDIKEGSEFAILTNIIHQEWSGVSVKAHKDLKGLKSHNLRDHMSEAELIFTALAELSTRQISETSDATGLPQNKTAAVAGGRIASQARHQLESQTGKSVVTGSNYLQPKDKIDKKVLKRSPKPDLQRCNLSMTTDVDPIALSALQHWHYCPRQCGLIHLEQAFDDNVHTLRGQAVHARADKPGVETAKGVRVERALPLWQDEIGLIGKSDVVEFLPGGVPYPVEYKHGSRHKAADIAACDDIQLAAQAMCLEAMTGKAVHEGAIFYATSKRRRVVAITVELRESVIQTAHAIRGMLATAKLPPPLEGAQAAKRCKACSLLERCQPQAAHAGLAAARTALFEPDA